MAGEDAYLQSFQQASVYYENKLPIVLGKDIDEEAAYNSDIYGKGAFFMHTLRYVMGDSIFFPALKDFITDTGYSYYNLVTTDDVENFFSKRSGRDLQPLFNLFLHTTDKLEIDVKRIPNEGKRVRMDTNPATTYHISLANIDMKLPLQIQTSDGLQTITVDKSGVDIVSKTVPVVDPEMYYLSKIIIE